MRSPSIAGSCGGVLAQRRRGGGHRRRHLLRRLPDRPSAIEAAEGALTALAAPIRVRMGVHTGTPLVTDEGYVGVDVHRPARIAAIGHGDQVLVSATTASLIAGDIRLMDRGEHRLKDLPGSRAHLPLTR